MMRRTTAVCVAFLTLLTLAVPLCRAQDTAAPATAPAADAAAEKDPFAEQVDLTAIRRMSVQHQQTLKTFDTYAANVLFHITAKTKLDGKSAAYTVLDIGFRPERYVARNLIYIRNKPFRQDLKQLSVLKNHPAEAERILQEGTISFRFWLDPQVQQEMQKIMATAVVKADAIGQINGQAATMAAVMGLPEPGRALQRLAILPPLDAPDANARPWVAPQALFEDAAKAIAQMQSGGPTTLPTTVAGYPPKVAGEVVESLSDARDAWLAGDAGKASAAFARLAESTRDANPAIYPSETKRNFEVMYNGLYRLTIPPAILYFVGFVLFLLAWGTEGKWFYRTAVVASLLGWVAHVAAIGIRWWLVEKSVGNWFESIPIKNQFESMLMSAFFGVTVALVMERKWRFGIFGAAAGFIGMLSLVAIFAAPYVTGRDIGGEIRQNAGILMTYWLYIHVTLVTASYALIGMTFVIGAWYLFQWVANPEATVLKTLDDCNLIMLQLAFWILGVGIITGALWADVSWGRPWAWDPKETFALITWIVYLVIIHVRFVTAGERRGLTTGVLSIVGFVVMLFNWFGVNFFLVGLHSYA